MVRLSQPRSGTVEVDFSQESGFDLSTHGLEITFGLTTRAIKPTSIVVEDGGDAGSVLRYLKETLSNAGFQVEMEASLGNAFKSLQDESRTIKKIRDGTQKATEFATPAKLKIRRKLLAHQIRAIQHGLRVVNPANFSVPGSGKTTVALSIFAALLNAHIVKKLFVIGPASCFKPWTDEYFEVFGKTPKDLRLIGNKKDRIDWVSRVSSSDLLLCTYQMAYREKDNIIRSLRSTGFLLVLDESHYVKNMNGTWSNTILELAPFAERRMILTGTPAPHSLKDLWSQFTFLWPSQSLVGTKRTFEKITNSRSASNTIRRVIEPFFVRISKKDLHLPKTFTESPRIDYDDIPQRQRTIIRLLEAKTLAQIKAVNPAARDLELVKRWRKARILRLMQASSNPMLLSTSLDGYADVDDATNNDPILEKAIATYGSSETPAKMQYVVNKARELVKKGKQVLIWATFIDNLRILKRHLGSLGAEMIYGEVPAYMEDEDATFPSRERIIKDFKKPKSPIRILLANPAACAESISLHTVCHDAIYLERSFNCGQFLQSLDRIHRVGLKQSERTTYYIPLIDSAIERVIDVRLGARQKALYEVLGDPAVIVTGLEGDWLLERDDELDDIFRQLEARLSQTVRKHA